MASVRRPINFEQSTGLVGKGYLSIQAFFREEAWCLTESPARAPPGLAQAAQALTQALVGQVQAMLARFEQNFEQRFHKWRLKRPGCGLGLLLSTPLLG